jgi:hypothetical protein
MEGTTHQRLVELSESIQGCLSLFQRENYVFQLCAAIVLGNKSGLDIIAISDSRSHSVDRRWYEEREAKLGKD